MRKLILATLATVVLGSAALAQGYPGGPYGPSGPYYNAPRPDFPGAKQSSSKQSSRQKCLTYAEHNASEAEPGARTAFYESCMHGMNTTAK